MNGFNRNEALRTAVEYRAKSVAERQLDIDNYIVSLELIDAQYTDNPDMLEYKKTLENLLKSAILEMNKEKVFLAAAEINLQKTLDAQTEAK